MLFVAALKQSKVIQKKKNNQHNFQGDLLISWDNNSRVWTNPALYATAGIMRRLLLGIEGKLTVDIVSQTVKNTSGLTVCGYG